MKVVIQGIPYETLVLHEAHDVHTTVLIPAGTDKTLSQLAQEGKIYFLPEEIKLEQKEKEHA